MLLLLPHVNPQDQRTLGSNPVIGVGNESPLDSALYQLKLPSWQFDIRARVIHEQR